jgi:hypothetical protein
MEWAASAVHEWFTCCGAGVAYCKDIMITRKCFPCLFRLWSDCGCVPSSINAGIQTRECKLNITNYAPLSVEQY